MVPGEGRLLVVVVAVYYLIVESVEVGQLISIKQLVRRVVKLTARLEEVLIDVELGHIVLARKLFVVLNAKRGLRILGVVHSWVKHYNI